jgi:cephalosporin hydroxylase
MMFDREKFELEKELIVDNLDTNNSIRELALNFVNESNKEKYAYIWNWFGLPIIQMPEDKVKVQEIIFASKPDLIIETGVAWGGSLLLNASVLSATGKGRVIGIDLTIPKHNRKAIMESPLSHLITLVEGSSTDIHLVASISDSIPQNSNVMLILDSHHTADHVIRELELWSPIVKNGNFIVVCDTIVEFIEAPADRPREWSKGNSPMTAVLHFLGQNPRFEGSDIYNKKNQTGFHPGGVLQAIR